ncbi:hypothetical protein D3C76_977890 [compost metagenome]
MPVWVTVLMESVDSNWSAQAALAPPLWVMVARLPEPKLWSTTSSLSAPPPCSTTAWLLSCSVCQTST